LKRSPYSFPPLFLERLLRPTTVGGDRYPPSGLFFRRLARAARMKPAGRSFPFLVRTGCFSGFTRLHLDRTDLRTPFDSSRPFFFCHLVSENIPEVAFLFHETWRLFSLIFSKTLYTSIFRSELGLFFFFFFFLPCLGGSSCVTPLIPRLMGLYLFHTRSYYWNPSLFLLLMFYNVPLCHSRRSPHSFEPLPQPRNPSFLRVVRGYGPLI